MIINHSVLTAEFIEIKNSKKKKREFLLYLPTHLRGVYHLLFRIWWNEIIIIIIDKKKSMLQNEPEKPSKSLEIPVSTITDYDYKGSLSSLMHHRGGQWKRQYCILKDALLYFYPDVNAVCAIGTQNYTILTRWLHLFIFFF